MKYLMTQEEFEQLIGRAPVPEGTVLPKITVIYFTAGWCGACRRLNMPALEEALPEVNWLKCDIDQNDYTPGYCGVRSIPSFVLVKDLVPTAPFTSSSNQAVEDWIRGQL